jgi:hypothetical protein
VSRESDHADGCQRRDEVEDSPSLSLLAYRIKQMAPMEIVTAPAARSWMDATSHHFADRCLPLLIANQAGWFILNNQALSVLWSGGSELRDLTVTVLDGTSPPVAHSHFGHGILTWHVPYLFRTPPGYNLLARGPANWPKDGIYPLEGMVETDWTCATFTMNWQVTRPGVEITFEPGEPICMIVPQRRRELEAFQPRILDIEAEPELAARHLHWLISRRVFNSRLPRLRGLPAKHLWQKHYFRGEEPGGHKAPDHQVKLRLASFEE